MARWQLLPYTRLSKPKVKNVSFNFQHFPCIGTVAKCESLSTYRIFSFVKSNESKTAGVIKDRPNIAVNFLLGPYIGW